jgi:diadenosine tetraphosphate (Ap4A) HIT family hydrolase
VIGFVFLTSIVGNLMNKNLCPFCKTNLEDRIILQNDTFQALNDLYPVSPGHTLLIPKRHITSFFKLTKKELDDFFSLIKISRSVISKEYSPDGFNIGINDGKAAGQTITHLHIHLIPRYTGDDKHPEGGIRKILPTSVEYPTSLDT